jgi:hypothetical protein
LKKLAKDAKENQDRKIAKDLVNTVQENKCKLLEDEIKIASNLGISMYKLIKQIQLYESGRISAIWESYTRTKKDTYKWSQLALPSTGSKRKVVEEWIAQYQLEFPKKKNRRREFFHIL